jgi:hypothetical protein
MAILTVVLVVQIGLLTGQPQVMLGLLEMHHQEDRAEKHFIYYIQQHIRQPKDKYRLLLLELFLFLSYLLRQTQQEMSVKLFLGIQVVVVFVLSLLEQH